MKYVPLDISMMKSEPFPYPLVMRPDLYSQKRSLDREGWGGRISSVRKTLQNLIHEYGEKAGGMEMVKTVCSVAGACVLGLFAVGVFWLAVEMDNSDLQAAKSSCSARP